MTPSERQAARDFLADSHRDGIFKWGATDT